MAASKTISIRLGLEGAIELKQQLEGAGVAGGAALEKLRSGLEKLGAQDTGGLVAALQRVTQAAKDAQTATAQAQANAFAGVSGGADYKARSADIAAYGAELDRLRAKFNPLFAASKQYESLLNEIGDAERVGAISASEAAKARESATAAFARSNAPIVAATTATTVHTKALNDVAASSGAAAASLRGLGIQFVQGISGIASGQPILTTFIQQGHQVVDTSLAMGTGLSGIGAAAKGLFNAIGGLPVLLGVGVVGALVAVGAAANSNASRLSDLRSALRLTHTDYAALADQVDAVARRVASSSTLTRSAAEDIAKGIASSRFLGEFAGELDTLTRSAADFSRVAGVDGAQAGKLYRLAIDDASAAVKQLADLGLPSFDSALVRNVERLDASGQHAGATRVIFNALVKDLAGAKDDTSELSKAFTLLGNSLTGTNEGFKGLGDALTGILADTIKSTARDIDNIVAIAQKAYDLAMKAKGLVTAGPVVDANTGQAPTGIVLPAQIDGQTASQRIYDIAQANNISARIADLGTRIANVESGGGYQFNASGGVLTSPKGALGMMQVMPGTAYDPRINPTQSLDPRRTDDNILLGLRQLALLDSMRQFAGNDQLVSAAFNAGEGRIQDVVSGKATLPNETAKYVQSVTGSPLSLNGVIIQAGTAAIEGKGGAPLSNADITVSSGLPDSVKRALGTGNDGTQLQTAQDASDRIQGLVRAITDLRGTSQATGPVMDRLQALLAQAREKAYGAVPAFDEITRASKDSLVPLQAQTGAARTVAEAVNQARIALSAKGQDLSDVQADVVRTQALQKLGAAFNDNVADIDRQIAAQQRINAVYQAAGGNILEIAARTKAEAAARETAIPNTAEYTRQVDLLTKKNLELAQSQLALQQIQQNKGVENNIALIQTETNTLGLSADQRTRLLAVMKAEQDMHVKYGSILPKEGQDYVDLIGKQADYTAALNHQKGALAELSSFFSNTFDTISNAITQAFATGNLQALKFKDIMHSVVSAVVSEFAKLAIINPLKNFLFNENNQTLSSVGGVLGNLLGGGASSAGLPAGAVGLTSTASGVSALEGLGLVTPLSGSSPAQLAAANNASTSGSGGFGLGGITSVGSLLSSVYSAIFGGGSSASGGLISGIGLKAAEYITSAGSSVASGLGFTEAAGAIGAATNTVATALPLIGTAVSVIAQLAMGNTRGAALTAGGAVVGGVLGGPYGAAIGAAVGGVVDALFPAHPLHPFDASSLNVQGGRLVQGKTLTQAETAQAGSVVDLFATNMNAAMDRLGLVLTNLDGTIGAVGNGIQGLVTVSNPDELFNKLQFANAPGDTSQFGVAKGALAGMSFATPQALTDELAKIAGFADATAAIGIKLKSVGPDLTNIQIASVSGAGQGNNLRTALSHDLTTQTFANVAALDAEINKVNQFINGTIPGLLHPIEQTTSAIVDQSAKVIGTYQDAIAQSLQYGIDNTAVLQDAEAQALLIVRRAGIEQIQATATQLSDRHKAASTGGLAGAADQAMHAFAANAQQQREALSKLWTDTYGDSIKTSRGYLQQMADLETTLGAERVAAARATAAQIATSQRGLDNTTASIVARQAALRGDTSAVPLADFDQKAMAERIAYKQQLLAQFGDFYIWTEDYAHRITDLEKVQQGERLKIVQQFGTAINTATADQLKAAQGSVATLFTSLADYVQKLQTGTNSPLSPLAQYDLAKRQFNAVAGAALAGDAASAGKLTGFADTFLNASRAVGGSGVGYATDFNRVLDAIQGVVQAPPDMLTNSFVALQLQQQTVSIVDAVNSVQAEMAALRTQMQLTLARMAQAA